MTAETWRSVVGYEGFYEVSSLGQVRSVARPGVASCVRKTRVATNGYLRLNLSINGIAETVHVHRLVAQAFVEGREPAYEIDHINGDKTDNRAVNLRWVSKSTNARNRHKVLAKTGMLNIEYRDDAPNRPWVARGRTRSGKHTCLGFFATADEAVQVRDAFRREHFNG